MATNNFSQVDPAINAPYTRAVVVTPSDTEDLGEITRALNVHKGTGGSFVDVAVILAGDSSAVTLTLETGYIVPIRVRRVMATNTNATNIVALY